VVGVNRFTDDSPIPSIERPDYSALAERQKAQLREVRAKRDAPAVTKALDAVAQAATGTAPLMPPIIEAVRARATLGEISDTLRKVWGVYKG
jgi:Methylmalonyl-CoA mutase, N-terminal domain/subunit